MRIIIIEDDVHLWDKSDGDDDDDDDDDDDNNNDEDDDDNDDVHLRDNSEANSYSCNRVRNRFLSVKQKKDLFHNNGGGADIFEHGGDYTSGGIDGCSGLGDYCVGDKLGVALGCSCVRDGRDEDGCGDHDVCGGDDGGVVCCRQITCCIAEVWG